MPDLKDKRPAALLDYLVAGLLTEEARHKQWYLEQMLRSLMPGDLYASLNKQDRWKPGTHPFAELPP